MGGYGSGGHNKRRPHLEGFNRINVNYLKRQGLTKAGVGMSMSWSDNGGRPTGRVWISGGSDYVTLSYSVRRTEAEDWRRIVEQVAFARVPKPFGGEELYFFCPRCGRRVKVLALGREYFRCRACLGAVHGSSQEGPSDRAMRRANKLRRRVGGEPGLGNCYGRPKHMRRRTFEDIDTRIQAADAEVYDTHVRLLARLGRFEGRMKRGSKSNGKAFW